ncbi:MAG: inositol-3-phosphate synthase [Desulfurococcaceae archaeon]
MIRVGIVGVGNIASMLVQSIEYYKRSGDCRGLIHRVIGGYRVSDIRIVYAIDVSERKVGRDLSEAIFAEPNLVPKLVDLGETGVIVRMGKVLDGVANHMAEDFKPAKIGEPTKEELAKELKENEVDVIVNLLPVGSYEASRFYAEAAAEAGASFINCIPEFIASGNEGYPKLFEKRKATLLGDDIKGQLGSTIVHRALASLIAMRGCEIIESYQLNVGGNTDFKNMLDQSRLYSKKVSKTAAVTSTQERPESLIGRVYAGPSGYIEFLGNTKVSYMYIKALGFMGLPVTIDLKLTVDDKAMATAILVDVIRLSKALVERGIYGAPDWASAPYFKHPPKLAKSDYGAMLVLYEKLSEVGISIEPKHFYTF